MRIEQVKSCEELVSRYRNWLEKESVFFKRQLGKATEGRAVLKVAKESGIELDSSSIAFFSVFGGQKSEREMALPLREYGSGLTLLRVGDACEILVNLIGRRHVFAASSFQVQYDSDGGTKNGAWRKGWIPLASLDDDVGSSVLFIDNDPNEKSAVGQVVLERTDVGWTSGKIVRRVLSQSLSHFFRDLLTQIERDEIVYKPRCGVVYSRT